MTNIGVYIIGGCGHLTTPPPRLHQVIRFARRFIWYMFQLENNLQRKKQTKPTEFRNGSSSLWHCICSYTLIDTRANCELVDQSQACGSTDYLLWLPWIYTSWMWYACVFLGSPQGSPRSHPRDWWELSDSCLLPEWENMPQGFHYYSWVYS